MSFSSRRVRTRFSPNFPMNFTRLPSYVVAPRSRSEQRIAGPAIGRPGRQPKHCYFDRFLVCFFGATEAAALRAALPNFSILKFRRSLGNARTSSSTDVAGKTQAHPTAAAPAPETATPPSPGHRAWARTVSGPRRTGHAVGRNASASGPAALRPSSTPRGRNGAPHA